MKSKFIFVITLTTSLIILLNIVTYVLVVNTRFDKINHYEDDNLGGYLHAKAWLSAHHPDVIFMGDSRTKYHIDTRWLNKQGINAYNAGVSGQFIEIWPTALTHLLNAHPKYIILGITVSDLYSPLYINSARSIGLNDIKMLFKTKQPISVVKNAIKPFVNASMPITNLNRMVSDIWKAQFSRSFTAKFDQALNCNIVRKFDYKGGYINLCENGDGVMTSSIKEDDFLKKQALVLYKYPNLATIRYLNEVITIIKRHHVQPIVILIPYYHKRFVFNSNDLRLVDCPVINLSDYFIDDEDKQYWANGSHFNEKGRAAFTALLYEKMKL